jgi:hypothetical protein
MSLLRAMFALAAALGLQVALARVWPDANRFLSLLLVLVAVYGISGSQRSAMFVGCFAGLFHDVWLQAGAFGITGFKWTLLGWVLGSVAARLDLDNGPARFVAGASLVLGDGLLNIALARLLDQPLQSRGLGLLLAQTLILGLLSALAGSIVDHRQQGSARSGAVPWRAG